MHPAKQLADANRIIQDFGVDGIQVLNGRYGPYIKDKTRNAKIPKDRDPKSLTLVDCHALLAAAPARGFGKWGRKNAKGGAPAKANGKSAAVDATASGATARNRLWGNRLWGKACRQEGAAGTPGCAARREGIEGRRQEAGAR
jgi:DNA topoisomerase-1